MGSRLPRLPQFGKPAQSDQYLWRVSDRASTDTLVHDVLHARWPGRFRGQELGDGVSLGEGGLGLDSIEIAELLVECMDRMEIPATRAEELLEAGPVTLGRLIDHLAAA